MSDVSLKNSGAKSLNGEIIADIARESVSRSAAFLRDLSFRSLPQNFTLSGPAPRRFRAYPVDPTPGSSAVAGQMMSGLYDFPGGRVQADATLSPWLLVPPGDAWAETLHGFSWLSHFDGSEDEATKVHMRWLVAHWIQECGQWHSLGWRPHVLARRLMSWFCHAKTITQNTDHKWRVTFIENCARQARHLARTAQWAKEGEAKLTAATALALSGVCLSNKRHRWEKGISLLRRELAKQILPDGGHISRNPSAHLMILNDLFILKDTLVERDRPVPGFLADTLGRMAPMVRFFRHGDGHLALFNGGNEESSQAIDVLLARDDVGGRPFGFAPHSGYQRLRGGRTSVVVDTGPPPKRQVSQHAHAGCLAFEMSAGRHRLIVNCGATALHSEEWQHASRSTAAHSTLTLADKSSAHFLEKSMAATLLGPRIAQGPIYVASNRDENEQGSWLTSRHDGYLNRFGLLHERRLYLSADGEDLRGEDALIPAEGKSQSWRAVFQRRATDTQTAIPFALRFHLHPDARPSLARDGASVLILLPGGEGWSFRSNCSSLSLEESVYLGSGAVQRTQQIVISGAVNHQSPLAVKWAIHRLSAAG